MRFFSRLIFVLMAFLSLVLASACGPLAKNNAMLDCVAHQQLYKMADQRAIDQELTQAALACNKSETVRVALIALGRIGGKEAADLIVPQLTNSKSSIRQTAAFALGISGDAKQTSLLEQRLWQETNPEVQQSLALAIGNLGAENGVELLAKIIHQAPSAEAANGAMQGLGIFALFHGDKLKDLEQLDSEKVIARLDNPKTSLAASFLLARVSLLKKSQTPELVALFPVIDADSQAFLLRALAKLDTQETNLLLRKHIKDTDIGVRLTAIRALSQARSSPTNLALLQLVFSGNNIFDQITAIQSGAALAPFTRNRLLTSSNSWRASETFLSLLKLQPKAKYLKPLALKWMDTKDPNLQRAAIAYFVKQGDKMQLEQLAKSDKTIIANGAKQALKLSNEPKNPPQATPDTLPEELLTGSTKVSLNTTQGEIVIRLFADTSYTSANFIKLVKQGFYDHSYFHRVIPNFVAQGGGKVGDGSSSVGYAIREELSQRSHRYGTVGMATAGKDTGGAQFFINLAPNLHLDSNYTIFGEVVSGMEVALKLEQNDQIIKAKLIEL
ncbi:peptidylprolyl isomerase [Kangiella sp. TOML190]|uniref:peptidylprolyl isomerase n=1 Tax=Kangiella sp. TOML190 TaxID=2931351 RepID=UPI00203E3D05|nr:peptidylprolyl isomerase [Kangiella sp. TOML190]